MNTSNAARGSNETSRRVRISPNRQPAENCYFHTQPPERAESGTGTSESDLSPFGISRPGMIRHSPYRNSDESNLPKSSKSNSRRSGGSDRRSIGCNPMSLESGNATSESGISPFGLTRPPTLRRAPHYCGSEVAEASSGLSQHRCRSDQSFSDSTEKGARATRREVVSEPNRVRPVLPESTSTSSNQTYHHPADPPRPAREGMEWVWFPEGYWAERERRELFMVEGKQSTIQKWFNITPEPHFTIPFQDDAGDDNQARFIIPKIKIGSLNTNRLSSRGSSRRPSQRSRDNSTTAANKKKRDKKWSSSSRGGKEKLGLYCRTKKSLETRIFGKHRQISDDSSDEPKGPASRTTILLEGTTGPLERLVKKQQDRQVASSNPGTPLRKVRGLAPWHHRNSIESMLSVSSSVHKILMGKSPLATPASVLSSAGRSQKDLKETPLETTGDTFLPSEARRIPTPPMSTGTPTKSPAFGFFTDALSPAVDDNGQSNSAKWTSPTPSTRAAAGYFKHKPVPDQRNKRKSEVLKPNDEVAAKLPQSPHYFELNTPEHLPSSPLCPRNPTHKSQGTGACRYHGRGSPKIELPGARKRRSVSHETTRSMRSSKLAG